MCEKGLNDAQLKLSIAHVEEMLGLAQGWLEQLHSLADRDGRAEVSAKLAQVTVALGESRSKLDHTISAMDGHDSSDGVTVELA